MEFEHMNTRGRARRGASAGGGRGHAWTLALTLALLSGCNDQPERPRSRFVGESALLAADEAGSIVYVHEYWDRRSDLSIAVLAGDVIASFGYQELFNPFGSSSTPVVELDAAPAGYRATLELRYRDLPLDQIDVEYAVEGVAGFMGMPVAEEQMASEDPLGAVCVLESQPVAVLAARLAADGRVLDAVFPVRTDVLTSTFAIDFEPVGFGAGVHIASFRAPTAGTHQVELRAPDEDRSWVAELRVVREDELVTLELQTPSEDGLLAGTLLAVLRTADGCPVVGAQLTLEAGGESVSWPSGWGWTSGDGLVEGEPFRALSGDLVATAIY